MSQQDFEIIAAEESPLGMIILRQRQLTPDPQDWVTEITLEHQFLMSSLVTVSERALSSAAIQWHGGVDLRVLVGGLGLGYTADEALASDRVGHVEVVELLSPVIGWMRDGLIPNSQALRNAMGPGGRLEIRQGNVYADLRQPSDVKYDLILIDVDHAPDSALGQPNDAFHSVQGVALARDHLTPGGVLAVWSCAPSDAFVNALSAVFEEVETRTIDFFNPVVDAAETNWIFLARGHAPAARA